MLTGNQVSRRYTTAIFDLANEQGQITPVAGDIEAIAHLLNQSDELVTSLEDPALPLKERHVLLQALFQGKVEPLTFTFLLFLAERKRLNLLGPICTLFAKLYRNSQGIVDIKVTGSHAMDPLQLQTICDQFKSMVNKAIQSQYEIDPSLLGGFKIQIGDLIYDLSVHSKLKRLRGQFI